MDVYCIASGDDAVRDENLRWRCIIACLQHVGLSFIV